MNNEEEFLILQFHSLPLFLSFPDTFSVFSLHLSILRQEGKMGNMPVFLLILPPTQDQLFVTEHSFTFSLHTFSCMLYLSMHLFSSTFPLSPHTFCSIHIIRSHYLQLTTQSVTLIERAVTGNVCEECNNVLNAVFTSSP